MGYEERKEGQECELQPPAKLYHEVADFTKEEASPTAM